MEELPGVLNWLLEGLRQFRDNQRTLDEPIEVTVATAGARVDSDPVHRFIDDELVVTGASGDTVTNRDMFGAWTHWCSAQRPQVPAGGINRFPEKLCKADSRLARPTAVGGGNTRTWHGVVVTSRGGAAIDRGGAASDSNDRAQPTARENSLVEGGAAIDTIDSNDRRGHVSPREKTFNNTTVCTTSPESEEEGVDRSYRSAISVAPPSTSRDAARMIDFGSTPNRSAGPLAWHGLLRKHATVLDPSTPCPQCGTPQEPDPELHIFQLCPECTSGRL
jgi:hypothetical protein